MGWVRGLGSVTWQFNKSRSFGSPAVEGGRHPVMRLSGQSAPAQPPRGPAAAERDTHQYMPNRWKRHGTRYIGAKSSGGSRRLRALGSLRSRASCRPHGVKGSRKQAKVAFVPQNEASPPTHVLKCLCQRSGWFVQIRGGCVSLAPKT